MAVSWICEAKGALLMILFHLLIASLVHATTNQPDVSALHNLFISMNSAKNLTSWSSNGTDPCGDMWKGVTCVREAVTQIHLPGFNLTGNLGYRLDQLTSLTSLDLSNNQLSGSLPYPLPPSLQQLDLSFNQFTGELPQSFSNLSGLSVMHLQNNSFSGNLSVLADLKLRDLNVENNQFRGWIPSTFGSISNLKLDGNNVNVGPASSPSTSASPPGSPSSAAPTSNGPSVENLDQKSSPTSSSTTRSYSNSREGHQLGIVPTNQRIGGQEEHRLETPPANRSSSVPPARATANQRIGGQEECRLDTATTNLSSSAPPVRVANRSQGKPPPANALTAFSLSDLQVATNSFHEENIIAESSFGPVYKGTLQKVVAVKNLNASDLQLPQPEKMKELLFQIASLHHPNITQLVGYYIDHRQCLLVYEYHSRGTLLEILHSEGETGKVLSWDARVKVALGAARALEYLHDRCMPPIVHKNFKSENIWLDEELSPHLADSGIAAFCQHLGQQASEPMSTNSDVYSFGVVMLELLTGRKPFDRSQVRWARTQLHDLVTLKSMVDPALMGEYPLISVSQFADIISPCVQPEPQFRPLMSLVVQRLVRLVKKGLVKQL